MDRWSRRRARFVAFTLLLGVLVLMVGLQTAGAQEAPPPLGDNTSELYSSGDQQGLHGMFDVIRTDDGGSLVVKFGGEPGNTPESTIMRLDADGEVINEESVPGSLQTITRVGENQYTAVGIRDQDGFAAGVSADGSVNWVETYGGEERDVALDAVSAPEGHTYLLSSTNSFDVETSDLRVVRVDQEGGVVWERIVEHEAWTAFPKGERLEDGSLIAAIRTKRSMDKSVDGKQNVSVARIQPDGSIEWRSVISSPQRPQDKEEMFDVLPAHGEGVVIVGSSNSGNEADRNFDPWAARVLPDGDVPWQETYDTDTRVFINDGVRMDGGYLLAGFWDPQEEPDRGFVMGIGEDGERYGMSTYAPDERRESRIGGIDFTSEGRLLVAGQSIDESGDPPVSRTWVTDVRGALPVEPSPSTWETQHGAVSGAESEGDASAEGGDSGSGERADGENDDETADLGPAATDSSMPIALYGATALATLALFLPYGLRRFGRN